MHLQHQGIQCLLGSLQLIAITGDFRHQCRNISTLGLGLADGLGSGITQVLQLLGAALKAFALGFKALEAGHIQPETTQALQGLGGFRQMSAEQNRV